MYFLRITLANHKGNYFATIGGAGFPTKKEWMQQWRSIPSVPFESETADFEVLLDRMPDRDTWDDTKAVSMETACTLLDITETEFWKRAKRDVARVRKITQKIIESRQAVTC